VLDAQRRTVFEAHGEQAPSPSVSIPIRTPGERVRGAAAAALGALAAAGVGAEQAGGALARHLSDTSLRPELLAALVAIPAERLSGFAVATTGDALIAGLPEWPDEIYERDEGRDALALADALVPRLQSEDPLRARRLLEARRGRGPQVLVLHPVPDSLQFDRRELTVAAGRPVELSFSNTDIMPHNLVLAAPGSLARVGTAGEALAARPGDAAARGWVPDLPEVLAATRLLQPGESQTLRWQAPATPGDFPYLCTFPGHWVRMNGVLHVVADASAAALAQAAAPPAAPTRAFVRSWTTDDFRAGLDAPADATRGREVLTAASCLKCHAIDGEGGRTGPDLRTVAVGRDRAALLQQVLQPSALIAKGYEAQLFFLRDGGVVSGRVLSEDAAGVDVLDDPYSGKTRHVALADVSERRASEVSVMPEGLLSTFQKQDVLDLLAFLESLQPAGAGPTTAPER
jgi:putative heme-binding domain-containing protein